MAAIDELGAAVTTLEGAASAAVDEINTLKASDNEAALSALAGRVATVATNLTNVVTPPTT